MNSLVLAADSSLSILSSLLSDSVSPQIIRDEQWPEICDLALQHGVGPLLLWSLAQEQVAIPSGKHWIDRLRAESRWIALEHIRFEIAQSEVNAEFRATGIPAIWLKGIALSHTVYPEPSLRPMGDLDVLVPYNQRQQALEIVKGLGYLESPEETVASLKSDDDLTQRLTHHYHLHSPEHRVILEVHFQFAKTLLSLEQMVWFYRQTAQTSANDGFTILRPEAHLLYLCAHATLQHGESEFRLLRYVDLHFLISKAAINWDEVVRQAVLLGWSYAVERALSLAVNLLSTPVPETVLKRLSDERLPHDVVSHAIGLQGPGARWGKVRKQLSLLPFSQQVRMIWRIAFPPPAYMRLRYQGKPTPLTALLYPYRWLDQTREFWFWTVKQLKIGKRTNENRP